jgi:hypothetical protein
VTDGTPEPTPQYRTGAIWLVLALLLTVGTVGAAFFVWGLTDLYSMGRYLYDVPAIVVGGIVACFTMLLITGILYRVDRLRGVPHKRVELFE